MTSKIISLESILPMDHDENQNDGSMFMTTRFISVGHPYDEPHFKTVWDGNHQKLVERHSDRDVISIEYSRNVVAGRAGCYYVKLKDGHQLRLPERSFIAEGVTDDEQ